MSAAALLLSLELQPCIISNSGVWKENSSPLTTVVGWKLTFKSLPPSHLLAEKSQCACSKYNKVICLVANFSFFRGNNFGKLVIAMRVSYNILFSSTVNIKPPLSIKICIILKSIFSIEKKAIHRTCRRMDFLSYVADGINHKIAVYVHGSVNTL